MPTIFKNPASVDLFHSNGGIVPGTDPPQYSAYFPDTSEVMRLERDGNGAAGIGGFPVEELRDRVREYLAFGCRISAPDKGPLSLTNEEIMVVESTRPFLAEPL
jgi:hypothetical protein